MTSTDYWLLVDLCPACRQTPADHEHCDPDRKDCPSLLCTCNVEVHIPAPRSES